MSHVETSRAAYEAFARGDIEAAFADLRDDCVFRGTSPSLPAGGEYRGKEAILGTWLPELGSTYEGIEVVPEQFIDGGDHVVVLGRERATVNGTRIDGPFCHVWRYEGDQVAEARFFDDSAQALRALEGTASPAMR